MTQIDGACEQDTDNENAEALQAALAQREVTLQGQPQGGSDVPSHQNSDPVRRIGNSTLPLGSYRKTSCTVADRGAFAEAVVFLSYFDDLPDPRQRGKRFAGPAPARQG